MNTQNVIEVTHTSKIFSQNYNSARKRLMSIFIDNFFGCKNIHTLRKDEFFALKNVSFTVKKNEKLAILGPNGSGKSTLLKMLIGIYMPDEGEIKINGQISSVLELSTGFSPELTGRDNIYLKFALQGKQKEDVDAIIDDVIAFSELEDFMDTPLKHYSSGMKSKLGFSIVSNMDPDILILDEVFAAGDKRFREKSEKRIKELYEGTTTILVTHSMGIVKDIADRVIVLRKGELVFEGDPLEGIEFYENMNTAPSAPIKKDNSQSKVFIDRLYQKVLGREPKEEGYSYWFNGLTSGTLTSIDLARGFMTSDEFQRKNVDSETFITVLYTALLDRKPTEQELNAYLSLLEEGLSREDLVERFIFSEKFLHYCETKGLPTAN